MGSIRGAARAREHMSTQLPEEHSHPYPVASTPESNNETIANTPRGAKAAFASMSRASKAAISLSAVWLLVCLAIGLSIMLPKDAALPTMPPAYAELMSNSSRTSYGGDAYTGIQNAASDTEKAVIAAANSAQMSSRAIEKWRADFEANALNYATSPLRLGIGTLVIGSGLLPLVVSLALMGRRIDEQLSPTVAEATATAG